MLAKTFVPQLGTMFGGWGGPLGTFGTGVVLGFVARMTPFRRFAGSIVTGAATIAAYDAIKLTPLAPQLGMYSVPSGYTPVFQGVGAYPPGFSSLAAGDTNDPTGFDLAP